jgi:ATP/maltotriose-dependent transcriptional regulator MalT
MAAAAMGRVQQRPQAVIDALGDLPSLAPMLAALAFWPIPVVALIDTGQLDRAADLVDRLDEAAAARGVDFQARLSCLRGQLAAADGRPEAATEHFQTALARFGSDDPFLERALTDHAFGQLLRVRGDRRRAVTELRTARQLLSAVGADPFVARVDADLAATGIHPADKSRRSTLELTDREHDVAVLVAQGLTNPEVAERLYVSRMAVEYHLRNIYGMLGITSRKELRTLQV